MQALFDNLMALSEDSATPFYHIDQERYGDTYRVFSYHFTDKDSWLLPDALESRGIMFEMDVQNQQPVRLACRTPHKFFNQGEVDFIEYGQPKYVMNKVDGSLISSFTDSQGVVRLKSKTSIGSDYANAAMEIIESEGFEQMLEWVTKAESIGYTVSMEYVSPSPEHRIVVYYSEPKLVVLNARHRETGEYFPFDEIPTEFFAGIEDVSVLDQMDSITGAEGYVVIDDNNEWTKYKCDWYLIRHRAKDFVTSPRAFVELVLKDEADDIVTLMADQPEVLDELRKLQHKVITKANKHINVVTSFYEENKHLERKDFAIKGRKELDNFDFSPAMTFYATQAEPDWTEYFLKTLKRVDWTE